MRGGHRKHAPDETLAPGVRILLASALLLGMMPAWAAPPARPRLGIKPRTVSPRYAYAVGSRSLRVQNDCARHLMVLRVEVQVINHGTVRIDVPVRLRLSWVGPSPSPLYVNVPVVAAGHAARVSATLPYPAAVNAAPVLDLSLSAAGQVWNRLRLPAPAAHETCPHIRSPLGAPVGESRR